MVVGADGDGADNGVVAVEDDGAGRGVGGGQIPQPRSFVPASRDEPVIVEADGDGADIALVAAENDGAGRRVGSL